MALVKPTINDIIAFDATSAYTVTFTANGGSRVVKNQIYIVTNNDNETVKYNNTVTSFDLSHTIPANTLSNGVYYKVRIRTYDELNNASEWSDYYPFRCYTTPNLYFISLPSVISNSTYTFNLRYTQLESEKLDYAIIRLYNNNNIELQNSGNLYNANTPPINFNYTVNNLKNNTQYKVRATGMTVEGTIVDTGLITFRVDYETIPNTDSISAIVDDCNGYVNVQSNVIVKVNVSHNPETLKYIDDEMVNLLNPVDTLDKQDYAYWVKWSGLQIPARFLLRLWFYPARQPFDVIRLKNDVNSTYINISLKRRSTGDYISIRASGNTSRVDLPLNTICNGNTKVFLWLKIIDADWEVKATVLEKENTILNWGNGGASGTEDNNIEYNVTTDKKWGNEDYGNFTPSTTLYNNLARTLTQVIIGNGIFDHLNITTDTSLEYNTAIPSGYTPQTLLNIDFKNNVGSNDNYTRLLLKRKDETMLDWINVCDISSIPIGVPTYINFDDSYIPMGVEQTYALVTYIDNVPSEYYTLKVTPKWGKYFLSDPTNRFPLNYAVIYSNHSQNVQSGVFLPIGAKYPIVIQNGEGNYRSGSLQFKILGYQYEVNNKLDRISMTKELKDVLTFLTNGKPKCLTDFNGNIFIFKVINSPQVSYDANWGNNIPVVSFDWVEQAEYNNAEEMLDLGLYKKIID